MFVLSFLASFLTLIKLLVPEHKGIDASLLVFDDGTDAIAEGELDDTLSVLANFQALQTIADQARTKKQHMFINRAYM